MTMIIYMIFINVMIKSGWECVETLDSKGVGRWLWLVDAAHSTKWSSDTLPYHHAANYSIIHTNFHISNTKWSNDTLLCSNSSRLKVIIAQTCALILTVCRLGQMSAGKSFSSTTLGQKWSIATLTPATSNRNATCRAICKSTKLCKSSLTVVSYQLHSLTLLKIERAQAKREVTKKSTYTVAPGQVDQVAILEHKALEIALSVELWSTGITTQLNQAPAKKTLVLDNTLKEALW